MRKITLQNYREDRYYPRITAAVESILERKNYVSPIDLFYEMGLLDDEPLRRWKTGQIAFLEKVILCNLAKASRILRILRFHAHDLNLCPSVTIYKHQKHPLRFSKGGQPLIEDAYSRHFVSPRKKCR